MPRPDGTPTIAEMLAEGEEDEEARRLLLDGGLEAFHAYKAKQREDKPWPPEEDCPGCPCHRDGPHKFGCSIGGDRQLMVSMTRKPDEQ